MTADRWIGRSVVTTEPLMVRRTVAGDIEFEVLPSGSACEVACEDEPGTYILVDEDGNEVWAVVPAQFRDRAKERAADGGIVAPELQELAQAHFKKGDKS